MKPTLLILAAGMGSRYGGLKQIDGIGPNEEPIIEYSIYDAIKAGFGKIVFVIRKEFDQAFRERFDGFSDRIEIAYAYQPVNFELEGIDIVRREKPWGTSHAVLVARDLINEPFAVINADDYYGSDSFVQMAKFLTTDCDPHTFSMVGYTLKLTLSDHGTVNRGICRVNEKGELVDVIERLKIARDNGQVLFNVGTDEPKGKIDPESAVSMNFWGFHPDFFEAIEKGLHEFVKAHKDDPKAEYFIPLLVTQQIESGAAVVKVLRTSSRWFGITFKADKPMAKQTISGLIEAGTYPQSLWN